MVRNFLLRAGLEQLARYSDMADYCRRSTLFARRDFLSLAALALSECDLARLRGGSCCLSLQGEPRMRLGSSCVTEPLAARNNRPQSCPNAAMPNSGSSALCESKRVSCTGIRTAGIRTSDLSNRNSRYRAERGQLMKDHRSADRAISLGPRWLTD